MRSAPPPLFGFSPKLRERTHVVIQMRPIHRKCFLRTRLDCCHPEQADEGGRREGSPPWRYPCGMDRGRSCPPSAGADHQQTPGCIEGPAGPSILIRRRRPVHRRGPKRPENDPVDHFKRWAGGSLGQAVLDRFLYQFLTAASAKGRLRACYPWIARPKPALPRSGAARGV